MYFFLLLFLTFLLCIYLFIILSTLEFHTNCQGFKLGLKNKYIGWQLIFSIHSLSSMLQYSPCMLRKSLKFITISTILPSNQSNNIPTSKMPSSPQNVKKD